MSEGGGEGEETGAGSPNHANGSSSIVGGASTCQLLLSRYTQTHGQNQYSIKQK